MACRGSRDYPWGSWLARRIRVELIGELVQYENSYRLGYVRGPESRFDDFSCRTAHAEAPGLYAGTEATA